MDFGKLHINEDCFLEIVQYLGPKDRLALALSHSRLLETFTSFLPTWILANKGYMAVIHSDDIKALKLLLLFSESIDEFTEYIVTASAGNKINIVRYLCEIYPLKIYSLAGWAFFVAVAYKSETVAKYLGSVVKPERKYYAILKITNSICDVYLDGGLIINELLAGRHQKQNLYRPNFLISRPFYTTIYKIISAKFFGVDNMIKRILEYLFPTGKISGRH